MKEGGGSIRCGNREIWRSFFDTMDILMDLHRREATFRNLIGGDMEKLLSAHKRFPGHRRREDAAWLAGDATPLILAGANWATREFSRARPDEVLGGISECDLRYGVIAEREMAVIAVCIAAWAKLASRQFFLMGSDNVNAIAWPSNGMAKQGTATTLLYCLFRYCIQYAIDIFSFMIICGRNITPDFLSRAVDTDVSTWAQRYEMTQIALPCWWSELIKMGPSWNWDEGRIATIREIQGAGRFDWNLRIADWDHSNGILPNVLQSHGICGRVTQVRIPRLLKKFASLGFLHSEGTEQCVFGHPKTPAEIDQYLDFVTPLKLFSAIVITPSEIAPGETTMPRFWTPVLWFGSAVLDAWWGDHGTWPSDANAVSKILGSFLHGFPPMPFEKLTTGYC